jgi:hypothetical protein
MRKSIDELSLNGKEEELLINKASAQALLKISGKQLDHLGKVFPAKANPDMMIPKLKDPGWYKHDTGIIYHLLTESKGVIDLQHARKTDRASQGPVPRKEILEIYKELIQHLQVLTDPFILLLDDA